MMNKAVISVLGPDRPGIIATVTRVLFDKDCNIENVSQTIIQSEFSGIFIVSMPAGETIHSLHQGLKEELRPLSLHVFVKQLDTSEPPFNISKCEQFIITTRGPDAKGLVARITEIIARYGVNVTNLQAIFKGGTDPDSNIMIYEVDIPCDIDQQSLVSDLREKAAELSLSISIQHKNIFMAINRI